MSASLAARPTVHHAVPHDEHVGLGSDFDGSVATRWDTSDIAVQLCYSERTVKNVVHDILMKLNCRTRAHAVALATRSGVI